MKDHEPHPTGAAKPPIWLTVGIPTFNRREKALRQSQAIARQMEPGVEFLLVDNCSDYPWEPLRETIAPLFQEEGKCRLTRNDANCGIAANILRVFELARGNWVWILGDDDLIPDDAIAIIRKTTLTVHLDRCFQIKFASNIRNLVPSTQNTGRIETISEFSSTASDASWMSNFIFISSSVFHREISKQYLYVGYQFASTLMPHVPMALRAIADGAHIKQSPDAIAEWIRPEGNEKWNERRFTLYFSMLADLPSCGVLLENAIQKNLRFYLGKAPDRYWNAVRLVLTTPSHSGLYWRSIFLRIASGMKGIDFVFYAGFGALCGIFGAAQVKFPFTRQRIEGEHADERRS